WRLSLSAVEYTATVLIPISLQVRIILRAISPLLAINILLNTMTWIGESIDYLAGSIKNKGWSYSTGEELSTRILTTFPVTSDSISLKSFIASMIQTVCPATMESPTFTKGSESGLAVL